jgi:hypothetical protein
MKVLGSRKLFALLAALAAVAAALAVRTLVLWPRWRVVPDDADRIKTGMTRTEVEAVLGRPETTRLTPRGVIRGEDPRVKWYSGEWEGANGTLVIELDVYARVESCSWRTDGGRKSAFDQLTRRAKRQWRQWFP